MNGYWIWISHAGPAATHGDNTEPMTTAMLEGLFPHLSADVVLVDNISFFICSCLYR